jgi:hypothetical protein
MSSIFKETMNPLTQEIPVKRFVETLVRLGSPASSDILTKTCRVLDRDNSGAISLDEWITIST